MKTVRTDNGASAYVHKEESRVKPNVEIGKYIVDYVKSEGGDHRSATFIQTKLRAGKTREDMENNLTP